MSSDSRKSLDHRDPLWLLSLNTSLDIETVILKVLIPVFDMKTQYLKVLNPVLISWLTFLKSLFQSQYCDLSLKLSISHLKLRLKILRLIFLFKKKLFSWLKKVYEVK